MVLQVPPSVRALLRLSGRRHARRHQPLQGNEEPTTPPLPSLPARVPHTSLGPLAAARVCAWLVVQEVTYHLTITEDAGFQGTLDDKQAYFFTADSFTSGVRPPHPSMPSLVPGP